jgi:xanthine dehydrogenase YagR molybdenum-binding subunit
MEQQFAADPINRVDGKLKVTGGAKYFAEYDLPGTLFAVLATSTATRATITAIDTKGAAAAPGVISVFTHENMPAIPGWDAAPAPNNALLPLGGQRYRILGSNQVLFNGQPIAVVVADTLERAQYGASLIRAKYDKQQSQTDLEANKQKAAALARAADYKRGEADAYKNAVVQIESVYTMPLEVHNPMELHGILASWEGDEKVTVYAKTQGVKATQRAIMNAFKLTDKNVQVYSEFVGGGFGMGLRTWPQEIAIVAIARQLKRPVKLVQARDQMFTMVGYRPTTIQTIGIGANRDGQITGITHDVISQSSSYEDFTENVAGMTKFMYQSPNVNTRYRLLPLDISSPIWMRGPGEATGAFALESAIDEMAYKLNMDPLEFRLKNYTETDPERNRPYSSKYVREAYQKGAEQIGWFKRNREPRSMKDGEWLVGYGMSTGVFNASRGQATCRGVLSADGNLLLQSATSDIGPGTGTAMTNIAHELLGIPVNSIRFELGDSSLPTAGSQGGSTTTSTVGSAVYETCAALRENLLAILTKTEGFEGVKADEIVFADNTVYKKADPSRKLQLTDLLKKTNMPAIEATRESKGNPEAQKYSMYSFSIHFTEVRVHPKTGVVRVKRVVTIADSGKIVSPKTAASQMIGGVTGGIGMALTEEAVIDHRYGRFINNNFADYHVPVSADVPHIETIFIDKPDPIINPMGAKGMGEIALIGFAAAVANAVYHATGKRVRDLPITPDKLLNS